MDELKVEDIHKEVSKYVCRDVTYIDALVFYAKTHDIEIEVIGEIVRRSPILKSKIRDDAEKLRLVEVTPKLPV